MSTAGSKAPPIACEDRAVEQVLPESYPIDADGFPAALRIQACIVRNGTPGAGRTPAPEVRPDWSATRAALGEPDEEVGRLILVPRSPHKLPVLASRVNCRARFERLLRALPEIVGDDAKIGRLDSDPLRLVTFPLLLRPCPDDLLAPIPDDCSPGRVALESGQHSLAFLLLRSGYRLDLERYSVLDMALQARRWDLFDLLLEWGADLKGADVYTVLNTYNVELYERFRAAGYDLTERHEMGSILGHGTTNRPLLGFVKRYRTEDSRIQTEINMALGYHAREGNERGVSLCVWAGADPHAPAPNPSSSYFRPPVRVTPYIEPARPSWCFPASRGV